MSSRPHTIAALKESGWRSLPVKAEIEKNLIAAMRSGEPLFPGVQGYEETVIPQLINALLSHHDIVLLGEKGQAKTRIMRGLAQLLDEAIPVIAGCEINDDPYKPLCATCKRKVAEHGDAVEIEWRHRDLRYGERLSPGAKIADLIGDLDPSKVAGGAPLASEEALAFGLIPRMNRGIFAVNELPDLDYLVQVSLFNILEERDVQIRGYPIRFDLDLLLLFSANPEDYSRAGKIIAPLKDRIGAEIRTHYPLTRETGVKIIEQEAKIDVGEGMTLTVPPFMKEIVEQITMEARTSPYVNQKSGVSARLSITNFETLVANARRRGLTIGESDVVPRIADLDYLHTSSSGKIELDPFREESLTEEEALNRIIENGLLRVFRERTSHMDLEAVVEAIQGDVTVETGDMTPAAKYKEIIARLPALWEPVHELGGDESDGMRAACLEFLLEGLTVSGRLTRKKIGDLATYRAKG